ncbi:MAG: right-handed parallel beta-helix repeat-containing protein [Methanophagales archaeon]|nr:right-handed parallel beta-helix repeat-containing protein [Methanophagales archaeon]
MQIEKYIKGGYHHRIGVNIIGGLKGEMLKMGNKSIWKILAILMVFVLAMIIVMPSAAAVSESDGVSSSATIYVPDSYPTIQAAVDTASPGDTIIVRDGTYRENIEVNKRLTIKSENGSVNCIVEAENRDDHVFEVTARYVNISGFTVTGAYYGEAGIYLYHADHCSISNNNCSNNRWFSGIHLEDSENNTISNNNCSNNVYGISLDESENNSITNNNCSNNRGKGIYLRYSKNNSISNNNCSNNDEGIFIYDSENNTIANNTCSNNDGHGIYLWYSKNNSISNNICCSNNQRGSGIRPCGIRLTHSKDNSISNNNCSNNGYAGISLHASDNIA